MVEFINGIKTKTGINPNKLCINYHILYYLRKRHENNVIMKLNIPPSTNVSHWNEKHRTKQKNRHFLEPNKQQTFMPIRVRSEVKILCNRKCAGVFSKTINNKKKYMKNNKQVGSCNAKDFRNGKT